MLHVSSRSVNLVEGLGGGGCVYNKDQKLSLYVIKVLLLIVKVLLNVWIAVHFNSLKYLMFPQWGICDCNLPSSHTPDKSFFYYQREQAY